ncbi:hypothetical protein AN958_00814 [Leucoagaricus sp. SymC.cos]|nr:hypothetical protein AN958_00814 [Leucoagaricus sp. SymC.cos]
MDTFLARAAAIQLVENALFLSVPDRITQFIRDLPVLPKEQVPLEDACPICLVPFLEILKDEDIARKEDTLRDEEKEAEGTETGVTKLDDCGHIFCRRDLAEWIRTRHINCPTCRSQFIPASILLSTPFGEDDGSSDGGEYLPPSEGEEDIDIDVDYSEPDFWHPDDMYESELESIPLVHEEFEEREAMMEDEGAWTVDYDPEYEDAAEVEIAEDMDPSEIDPAFDLGLATEQALEEAGNNECMEEQAYIDARGEILGAVEEGDWETHQPCRGDAVSESGAFSDSEQEELEVEWGLTDGESIASAYSEDDVRGLGGYSDWRLTVPATEVLLASSLAPVAVRVSNGDEYASDTVLPHTHDPQSLK